MQKNGHVYLQKYKKKCLDYIIDECQSGFMKGRHISNNIRLMLDLIDYNEFITDNSCI